MKAAPGADEPREPREKRGMLAQAPAIINRAVDRAPQARL